MKKPLLDQNPLVAKFNVKLKRLECNEIQIYYCSIPITNFQHNMFARYRKIL